MKTRYAGRAGDEACVVVAAATTQRSSRAESAVGPARPCSSRRRALTTRPSSSSAAGGTSMYRYAFEGTTTACYRTIPSSRAINELINTSSFRTISHGVRLPAPTREST